MTTRVGPAGWSYTDWEGTVYPPHGSRFDHLAYLADFFDTIEINSPFYRIPPVTHAKSWIRRVGANRDFKFTTKIYRGFTHEKTPISPDEIKAFRNYLDPLMEADRLGVILLQFPWSFKDSEESRDRIAALLEAFDAYPAAVEVRHASFQTDDFARFLDERQSAFVMVDQPLFADSVKPAATVTSGLGYVRLHGRNYEKWFAHEESWERYNYLYTEKELDPWVERINSMEAKDVYVIANNHFRGQAIVNAGDLKHALGQSGKVPPQLVEVYGASRLRYAVP